MYKYILLLLFLMSVYGQSADTLVVDKAFYENGNLKHQRFYKNGVAYGKWSHFYENGNIWIEANYKNGIKIGLWTTYYENGQESTKGDYGNNERSGKWIFYNQDGTVYETKEY